LCVFYFSFYSFETDRIYSTIDILELSISFS
jgi:hypothetical protein